MKPSILDDIKPKTSTAAQELAKTDSVMAPYSSYEQILSNNTLETLNELALSVDYGKGVADRIIDNIYYYKSKVDIIKNDDNQIFLILRDAKVVIDLFHYLREWLVGENNTNTLIEKVLEKIGCESYVFLSLKEAELINDLFRESDKDDTIKRGSISLGECILGQELWRYTLTTLFYGEHNWACGINYFEMLRKLNDSLLPYQVICYEDSTYIKIENGYCIEGKQPKEYSSEEFESYRNTGIAIFSLDKSSSPNLKLIFHGVFELDKERSLQDGYISFKYLKDELTI